MARTMGRGSVQSGGRGFGRSSGRESGRSIGRGSSQCSGLRSIRGIGQGSGHIGDRGVGEHGDRDGGQASDGCNGQRGGHIGDGGSGIGSCDNTESQSDADQDPLMPSPIDGDDESTVHVARRGRASQVQVPEQINREWIWIEDGQFSNQATSTRIIGLNLKHMWLDAWDSWRDVSYEHRMKLFERFKEKTLGRELKTHEMWKQSHCRKGSRPLDKDLSSLLVSDDDSEGSVQGENLNWVDNRAKETWVNYKGYVVEKYGDNRSIQSAIDKDLWTRAAGGIKKGKVYGLSNVSGPRVHGRQDPEIEKLHLVIKELVKEKEEDKERLNEIIKELTAEKEKDKAEKDAIVSRMTSIEVLLKSMVR